jgi:hypothetical protein
MANRDLLKEAIADAKAVKETAIANAKVALEEAFTPFLKEKLAAKLAEMDEMDEAKEEMTEMKEKNMEEGSEMEEGYDMDEMKHDMDEAKNLDELDLDELLRELESMDEEDMMEGDSMDEGKAAYEYEKGKKAGKKEAMNEEEELINNRGGAGNLPKYQDMVEEDMEDEEIDLENMDENDLKKFIEDVIADMVASGELEGNMENEEEMEDEEEMEMEITERKKLKSAKMMKEGTESTDNVKLVEYGVRPNQIESYKRLGFKIDEQPNNVRIATMSFEGYDWMAVFAVLEDCERMGLKPGMEYEGRNYTFERAYQIADEKAAGDEYDDSGVGTKLEIKSMKKELDEAYAALRTIKNELNEVNLFNAKLLYTNKIFKAKNLNEAQKVKVLESFDKATNVNETKLVYETLFQGIKETKKSINESLLRSSASKFTGIIEKKPIIEADAQVLRMQKLAGIIK